MHQQLKPFRKNKLLLLCASACLIVLSIAGYLYLLEMLYQDEKTRVIREANLAVDAFEQHTIQVVNQVDVILHSVRMLYLRAGSVKDTERFIDGLNFDKSVIDNVYLISANGTIINSHGEDAKSLKVNDRDYFRYHQSTRSDRLFISPVEKGHVTGKYHFRITRRINNPDGSFGGIVLASVNPQSFSRYYHELKIGSQNVASLVGIRDKRLRARMPEPDIDMWAVPAESPIWAALEHAEAGSYENQSALDNIHRTFMYRTVGELPLVMVVGFSDEDLQNRIFERKNWLILAETTVIIFILIITAVLLNMVSANEKLRAEIIERKRTEAERERLIIELQEALAQVKQLEGILPICSFCKKIRDDEDHWHALETFISHRSEAMFSHSCCPDCGKKHYQQHMEQK